MFTDLSLQVALVGQDVMAAAKFTDLSLQITPYKEDGKKYAYYIFTFDISYLIEDSYDMDELCLTTNCGGY